MDTIIKAISENKFIRACFATTTTLVNDAFKIHHTTPTATAALGRCLTGTAIMGSLLKGEKDTVTVQFKGNGPLGTILGVSNSRSCVKGYVTNPDATLPKRADGKLAVGEGVGRGTLTVIKDVGLPEPQIGTIPLETGEIADDLTAYFAKSEQTPTSVALGVLINTDYSVSASGGFVIQLMPDADDNLITELEKSLMALPPVSSMIAEGLSAEEMMEKALSSFNMKILSEEAPRYECDCSEERVARALISMGKAELEKIIKEDKKAEISCHFCNNVYNFNEEKLQELIKNCTR